MILFANYFFYAKWDLFYLALIPAVSSCDYVFGLGLQYSQNKIRTPGAGYGQHPDERRSAGAIQIRAVFSGRTGR